MQSGISITSYDAICNLGNNIDEIFENALKGSNEFLSPLEDIVKDKKFYFGKVNCDLPQIKDERFNLRVNRLLLHLLNNMEENLEQLFEKYPKSRIGTVIATTNSGIEEYEKSHNKKHFEIGNPAEFIKYQLGLESFYTSVSTACSSGIKAFATARKLISNGICDAVIVGGTDALSKLPVFGFHSLEILSETKTNPFSKNRNGINLGEGAALFIVEKAVNGIKIKGIGETSDAYHSATPDPKGIEAERAMKIALKEANLVPDAIDYINLHGTGTKTNDLMEANAVYNLFGCCTEVSATKPLTGHCLGAAASIETALCCHIIKHNTIIPHVYDGKYDYALPDINLITKPVNKKIDNVLCNAFGFSGTNAVMILGRE